MDGPEGQDHPWNGAHIACRLFKKLPDKLAVMMHVLGHSKHFSKKYGFALSPLYAPDKLCAIYDPAWFYLLRANLSGEVHEFMANAPAPVQVGQFIWYRWYQSLVRKQHLCRKNELPTTASPNFTTPKTTSSP
jgi:hypothetical protein